MLLPKKFIYLVHILTTNKAEILLRFYFVFVKVNPHEQVNVSKKYIEKCYLRTKKYSLPRNLKHNIGLLQLGCYLYILGCCSYWL